jgi:hypothetical protein
VDPRAVIDGFGEKYFTSSYGTVKPIASGHFCSSNQCIPLKNIFGLKAAVSCEHELILLFSSVFYFFRAVHKFDLYARYKLST